MAEKGARCGSSTSPVSTYSCYEYNLNAKWCNTAVKHHSENEIVSLTIMVGLHLNSHPLRDNNNNLLHQVSKQLCVRVCDCMSVCVDFIYLFVLVECVWVTAAVLCCHGDS